MGQRNVKLTIAYDGSGYHGWQRQEEGIVTVQEVLEGAMVRTVGHPVKVRGSGRTDTGVHAAGYVANFFTDTRIPSEVLHDALNSRLPRDVRVRKAEDVADDFDAILSSKSKLYRYTLFNGSDFPPCSARYAYHFWRDCELGPMQEAGKLLVGEHDFASFAASRHKRLTTVRTVLRCEVSRDGEWIYFDVEGTGFLYHMVRNIVGTLVEVGRRYWPPEHVAEVLAACDRTAAGPTAPANGLSLEWVKY